MESIKNVIVFLTDQERAVQNFPPNWEKENLPGLTRLKEHGLTFENSFTNACMCSAARSTWMSGYFPAQHGVKYTLEADMYEPDYPQVELPKPEEGMRNIATAMTDAGFNVVYKGKWHCSKPADKVKNQWVPKDLADYGFARWNPQDAGANQDVPEGGGAPGTSWKCEGDGNNDERFMFDEGEVSDGKEGVLAYLKSQAAAAQPFFLIISLVNPHDVLFYPKPEPFDEAGYGDAEDLNNPWLTGDICIPESESENLITKPSVQAQFLRLSQGLGVLKSDDEKRAYLNYYGNLMIDSDRYLGKVLDALGDLWNDTLIIRTSDHGEMGLAYGGQRQKNFNFYEESIRVPLVYSNPCLYPEPKTSHALVSHVDFLPTLAGLFPPQETADNSADEWQGVDYSTLVKDPSAGSVQDYIVFTYDDYQSGQKFDDPEKYPDPPNHIVSIREEQYKFAEYYDATEGSDVLPQYEMYDLSNGDAEKTNLAFNIEKRSDDIKKEYERLKAKLDEVKETRLKPLT